MEHINLLGAETVQRASSTMGEAASQMQHAANTITNDRELLQRFLDDWLERLRGAFDDHITMIRQSQT